MRNNYIDFFKSATGFTPYPYQIKLAISAEWPEIINVDTGLGKTAAVIVAWLYKRNRSTPEMKASTPRRLVLCLPTRVLVEQTYESARAILGNLGLNGSENDKREGQVAVSILWGGDVDNDIDRHLDRDMIIVGTQDMLLSRALNRGYAMSKFRWPAHFALLNNDSLWVLDEVQLMGPGLQTSAQLEAFRSSMGVIGAHHTIWMSATLDVRGISTVDHPIAPENARTLVLESEDRSNSRIESILSASKKITVSPIELVKDEKKNAKAIASRIRELHEPGTLTLAIFNTVSRAKAVFCELEGLGNSTPLILLHSHYRPSDRSAQYGSIKLQRDAIVVSTQVVEAGADISARTLITDLAPWPSMVQRFGRCNRRGERPEAIIEWIDPIKDLEPKTALPYYIEELMISRNALITLSNGSPSSLMGVRVEGDIKIVPVIRRKDLLDLFDTTPDLLGNELDISRFIRSNDSSDVFAFWRDISDQPLKEKISPSAEELCSVPIEEMKKFLDGNEAWTWDHIDAQWARITKTEARSLRPGQLILLDAKRGGYSASKGWTGSDKDVPRVLQERGDELPDSLVDAGNSDRLWITLDDHTAHVISEVERLCDTYPSEYAETLREAARWHDVGKAHEAFQSAFTRNEDCAGKIWGKGPRDAGAYYFTLGEGGRHIPRPYFRHELASALAYRAKNTGKPSLNLTAYLIAAHHGKVRMSLRSVPSERGPDEETLFARGVWDGDRIHYPGMLDEDIIIDMSPIRLGPSSWANMTLGLRDQPGLGPFRLAFLETILRVADWRASEKEGHA